MEFFLPTEASHILFAKKESTPKTKDNVRLPVPVTMFGIEYMQIKDVALLSGRSVMAFRSLIFGEPTVRTMKFTRIRSKIFIPVSELEGYPFVKQGATRGPREVYHYKVVRNEEGRIEKLERFICEQCSYGNQHCSARVKADTLDVPVGDE